MAKKKIVISEIKLEDIYNDTIQTFGGITLSTGTKAADLVTAYPGWAFIKKTTLGARVLCVCRRDGKPFVVSATNPTSGTYTAQIANLIRLFGPRRRKPRPTK